MGWLHGIAIALTATRFYERLATAAAIVRLHHHRAAKKMWAGHCDPVGFGRADCYWLRRRFFAQLIKAAVSRQREYLADASAVQFTRAIQTALLAR